LRQWVAGRPAPGSAADPAELAGTEVHVDMLAAPVNPSDINQVQGLYPIKPAALPAVAGMEGVGRVVAVGPQVTTLRVGDWVAPTAPCLGAARRARFNRTGVQAPQLNGGILMDVRVGRHLADELYW